MDERIAEINLKLDRSQDPVKVDVSFCGKRHDLLMLLFLGIDEYCKENSIDFLDLIQMFANIKFIDKDLLKNIRREDE